MEYEKQIEIKLEGNNCIINIPKEQNVSLQNNSLTNIDDISFSVSVTSDDDKNSRNNIGFYNKDNNISNSKQYLYSNEKSKLEITFQSIFNSELKSESSNIKTPFLLLNSKNKFENNLKQQIKDSVVKKLNFDINSNNININEKTNSEIPNINIRKLPMLKRNNIIKNISKNLNKEYFIHEKIYSSNKNIQRILLDKKIKENSIKNSNMNNTLNKNKTQIIDNNIDIFNNDSININKYQITENFTTKGNLNFLNNKINNNSNLLLLNKCSSKQNVSNMRTKLNNILKLNTKEKENNTSYKEKQKNNTLRELDIMPKINNNENISTNNNIIAKQLNKNKILYPSLTSGNNNANINTFNSFNKSANNNKMKSFNINENPNIKTPLVLNKQIILKTPKTNSYSCSTSYSAKNNKIQNDINISTEKDPILVKIEAHNSLLKNFFLNKNNFKNKENKENINNNIQNDNNKNIVNKFNNNTSEKSYGKIFVEESININNKGIRLKKFNTDFKLPINKNKKLSLLTERNMKNNHHMNIVCLKEDKYANINRKLYKKNEFDYDIINPIIK